MSNLLSRIGKHIADCAKAVKFEIAPSIDDCIFEFSHFQHDYTGRFWNYIDAAFEDAVLTGQVFPWQDRENNRGKTRLLKDPCCITAFTICYMKSPTGELLAKGYSFCGEKDHFNKKLGREMSKERAIQVYLTKLEQK